MQNIEVRAAAAEEESILANLVELYAHDFSEFLDIEINPDGRYGYAQLPLYWREPNRHPLLVRVDGNLAGFVLLKGDENAWDMAEFFVVRRYRRRGIGSAIAHEVWRQFPGRWAVRVMESNQSAQQFWERVIRAFAGETTPSVRAEKDGKVWHVFSFETGTQCENAFMSSTAIATREARVAQSVETVPHSRIRELADIAFGMEGVLKLYFGESNQSTPAFIKQAASKALEDGHTFYSENGGIPSLRETIARQYRLLQNVTLDPKRELAVTASGVQALFMAIRAVLDPGDEGIVLTPAWPNGASIIGMANATAVLIAQPLRGDRYDIDWEALEAAVTPRTRMLLFTSPSNPLGWVATEEDRRRLLEFSRRHGLWLIADEVYDRLWYEGAPGAAVPSILTQATRDDAVVAVQSFSKSYCMTGWRLGWLAGRADLIAKVTSLNEFVVSHAPTFTQKAGETAMRDGETGIREMVERLRSNRDFAMDALRQMRGLNVPRPEGAFYLFPQVEGLTDSFDFCRRLLVETKVGLAPGVAFGPGGEGSIRICYAADRSVLEPAMERLAGFLSRF